MRGVSSYKESLGGAKNRAKIVLEDGTDASKPLREDGSMWRGSCGIDPSLWGREEEVDG